MCMQYARCLSSLFCQASHDAQQYMFQPQYIYYDRKLLCNGTFVFFLAGEGINITVHVALPKRPINQFYLVQQSRQQTLRAYCLDIYTLLFQPSRANITTCGKLREFLHFISSLGHLSLSFFFTYTFLLSKGNCGFSFAPTLSLRHFINRPVYKGEIKI